METNGTSGQTTSAAFHIDRRDNGNLGLNDSARLRSGAEGLRKQEGMKYLKI